MVGTGVLPDERVYVGHAREVGREVDYVGHAREVGREVDARLPRRETRGGNEPQIAGAHGPPLVIAAAVLGGEEAHDLEGPGGRWVRQVLGDDVPVLALGRVERLAVEARRLSAAFGVHEHALAEGELDRAAHLESAVPIRSRDGVVETGGGQDVVKPLAFLDGHALEVAREHNLVGRLRGAALGDVGERLEPSDCIGRGPFLHAQVASPVTLEALGHEGVAI